MQCIYGCLPTYDSEAMLRALTCPIVCQQSTSHAPSQLSIPVHDGLADGQVSLDGDGQGHVDGGAEGDGGHRVQEVDVETRE